MSEESRNIRVLRRTNCTENTRNYKRISQILREKGEGISWMKIILMLRKENKTKEIIKDNLEIIKII